MLKLEELKSSDNIVNLLLNKGSEEERLLAQIGEDCVRGYTIDEDSREEWKRTVDEAMKIAKQCTEAKNHPWPGASNIKFPLITDAAIDYASRTLPEIIQNEQVVKCATMGADPKSELYARADRVARFMSYQLVVESPDWEDSIDKLLQILPVLGTVFKKTYYSSLEKRNVSELCVPDKIVVNYNAQSLESARRITHLLTMYENDVVERQRKGIFRDDIDACDLLHRTGEEQDSDSPIDILEQHCWLDLDEDGYKEPYIVTIHLESKKVLRIVSRFKKINKNKDGEVSSIVPDQYFTDFHFIRSPDGGFYSQGFGSLLLPVNSSINTLINQLIDSGTLSNTQGGFLGRGLRIKNGEFKIKMGEWKVLDAASGTSIKDNVFPLPVREPSQVLFNLLGLLIQVGKDITSTTDALSGSGQAQNVSSNVQNSLVEQGTKVFTAINKRLYRSLKKEYTKLYELNNENLKDADYRAALGEPEASVKADFELETLHVHPIADPTISSMNQRLQKFSVLQTLRTADARALDVFLLESLQLDKSQIAMLLPSEAPPPGPDMLKTMSEVKLNEANAQAVQLKAQIDMQAAQMSQAEFEVKARSSDAQIQESMARVWKMQKDSSINDAKVMIAANKAKTSTDIKDVGLAHKIKHDQTNLQLKAAQELNKAQEKEKEQAVKAAKLVTDMKMNTENNETALAIAAQKVGKKPRKLKSPDHTDDNIKHTAMLKGMTEDEVRKQLGYDD